MGERLERKEWDVASKVTKCSQSNHKDTKSKHTVAHAHTHAPPERDESHWSVKWRLIRLIKPRHRKCLTTLDFHLYPYFIFALLFCAKIWKVFSVGRHSRFHFNYWWRHLEHRLSILATQADWWVVQLGKLPTHRSAVSISSGPAHTALCTACWLEFVKVFTITKWRTDFLPVPPGSVTWWCPQRRSECPHEEEYLKISSTYIT